LDLTGENFLMTSYQFVLIILTVAALSAGQMLFKMAATSMEFSSAGFVDSLLNTKLIVALIVYFVATIMWLIVLKVTPLRIAYPFVSLAFIVVPILAHYVLGESINWNTFAGAALIGAGVLVSVYQ
jgi:drug/metabolite transporter (DMT)-like permease